MNSPAPSVRDAALTVPASGNGASFERLCNIVARLRAPGGCPWDREQTLETLRPCLVEESYELLDVMAGDNAAGHCEELGDVLLQVVFQALLREEKGEFAVADVLNGVSDKLVRRHPHVFGDVVAKDPATVLKNWEQIKQQEHRKELRHSALDGVPATLPALLKAQRTQEKAARVGFDWKDAKGPLEKIREELGELEEAVGCSSDTSLDPHVKEELGDLIFAVANLARHLKADAESALENTTAKFSRRFRAVEAGAKEQGKKLKEMTLEEMDALWDAAKRDERA